MLTHFSLETPDIAHSADTDQILYLHCLLLVFLQEYLNHILKIIKKNCPHESLPVSQSKPCGSDFFYMHGTPMKLIYILSSGSQDDQWEDVVEKCEDGFDTGIFICFKISAPI